MDDFERSVIFVSKSLIFHKILREIVMVSLIFYVKKDIWLDRFKRRIFPSGFFMELFSQTRQDLQLLCVQRRSTSDNLSFELGVSVDTIKRELACERSRLGAGY